MILNPRRVCLTLAAFAAFAAPTAAFADGRVAWSGKVDDTAIISIQARDVQTETVTGNSVSAVSTEFSGRLPRRPVFVSLSRWDGRGQVRLIQQPTSRNGFTARVRIHDPQAGSSRYRFTLNW